MKAMKANIKSLFIYRIIFIYANLTIFEDFNKQSDMIISLVETNEYT